MNKSYIREHVSLFAVTLFLLVFGFIQAMKPAFLYNSDGSIREFGIGYKNKTILPVWLLSIVLGILCYVAILAYVTYF
jgi:hypothetical protein